MNTCDGCKHWRLLDAYSGGMACHYALDTGRLRNQSAKECTHYSPRDESMRFGHSAMYRNYDPTQDLLLDRLKNLKEHIKKDVYYAIKGQIVRGELDDAAHGLDTVERRLHK